MTGEGAIVLLVVTAAVGWVARHLWNSLKSTSCGGSCCPEEKKRPPESPEKMEV